MPYYTDGPIGADAGLQDMAPSLGMSVGAAVEDAFTSNPTKVIYDYSKFARANDAPRLDKADAEGRVKSAGVSLKIPDEGYSEDALNLLIDRKRDEVTRQSILARAPAGIIPSTARFSASLLTGVLDPLNVASAFVPVVGELRYAEMLAQAGGAIGRAGVRAGVGAAEGLVGAALVEPINYFGRTQMQDDYHMSDSLLNLAMGAGLGGVLHTGGGAIGDKLGISDFARSLEVRRAEEATAAQMRAEAGRPDEPISLPGLSAKQAEAIDRVHQEMGTGKYAPDSAAARAAEMTPEGREAAMRVAVAQAMEGRIPDVEVLSAADRSVDLYHGSPHEFTAFDSTRIGTGEGAQAFGRGLYLADSPGVAAHYRDVLSRQPDAPGSIANSARRDVVNNWITQAGGDRAKAASMFREFAGDWMDAAERDAMLKAIGTADGFMYQVRLKDEHLGRMLDFDGKVGEQAPLVRRALEEAIPGVAPDTPIASLIKQSGSSGELEERLRAQGVFGIKYLNGVSRDGSGTGRNFVVFPGNEGELKVVKVNDREVTDPVGAARATAERQASPESIAVADFNAARAADERIAAEAKTDPAQALLDSTTEKLDALLKNLEQRGMDPGRIEAMRAELAPFDEALADSKKLGAAMKAAAICGIQ